MVVLVALGEVTVALGEVTVAVGEVALLPGAVIVAVGAVIVAVSDWHIVELQLFITPKELVFIITISPLPAP